MALKRPSTSLKRPAASINETINKMQKGCPKPAEDEADENSEDHGRDKAKGQKFAKMRSSLPDHVIDLFERESAKASSPRQYKTMIINKLFVRDASGKLVLNLEDELFQEHKKIFSKKYAREEESAMPELVMRGLYFANSETAMEEAKKRGEIIPVDCGNDKVFWAFTTFSKGVETGRLEEQSLLSKKKVSKEQAKLLAEAFKHVGWSWKYQDKDIAKLSDGQIPPVILTLVTQATESQQKLAKEAMIMIKNWKGAKADERLVKLKKGHAVCNTNLAKLAHMREFHELPDDMEPTRTNLDKLMQEMAAHTKEYNELVETCRGVLRSLKN